MATTPNSYIPARPHLAPSRSGKVAPPAFLRAIPSRQPSTRTVDLLTRPKEPEDAFLTGGTRSLDRRLLALNLPSARSVQVPAAEQAPVRRRSA